MCGYILVPRPSHRAQMASFLGLARFFFLCFFVSSAVAAEDNKYNSKCKKPKVRREWRDFSTHEQEEWINAVNVCSSHGRPAFPRC